MLARAQRRRRPGRALGARAGGRAGRRRARSTSPRSRTRCSARAVDYDRQGDRHYDFISAWIKATRGSDVDASLYYLAVMLEGGEDPRFIARRMVILASEDIGNADPQALLVADAAARAVDRVGLPECALNLAPGERSTWRWRRSRTRRRRRSPPPGPRSANGAQTPPDYLRDAHYPGAAALGRGKGYRYAHDEPGGVADQQLLPEGLAGRHFLRADRARLRGGARPAPRGAAQRLGKPERPPVEIRDSRRSATSAATRGFLGAAFQAKPGRAVTPTGGSDWGSPVGINRGRGRRAP